VIAHHAAERSQLGLADQQRVSLNTISVKQYEQALNHLIHVTGSI